MNKFLRLLFVLVIIAMLGASILQIFFPSYMGSHSGYGISAGWQREIGIGTNHLLNYMEYHSPVNAIGAFENYLLVIGWIVGWIVGWLIERHSIKKLNASK